MSDDSRISAETLSAAKNQPTKNKNKTIKWAVTGVLLTIVLGLFGYGMFTIFRPPSPVTGTFSLNQNLPPKAILNWGATGNFEEDNTDTPTGTWKFDNTNGNFANTGDWAGCNMYWNRLVGDTGDTGTDLGDTNRYTEVFFGGQSEDQGQVYFPVKDGEEVVGSVELQRTAYVDEAGQYSVGFYRHSPDSALLMFGTVRCADEVDIEKLVPADATGDEISDLFGVWLATER